MRKNRLLVSVLSIAIIISSVAPSYAIKVNISEIKTEKEQEAETKTEEVTTETTTQNTTEQKTETKTEETKQTTQNNWVDVTQTAEYKQLLAQQMALQAQYNQLVNEQAQLNSMVSADGSWIKEDGFWTFYDMTNTKLRKRWMEYNNAKYYFDEFGHMATGWVQIDRKWYFFDKNGNQHIGWYDDGNNQYYLNPNDNGAMCTSDATINGELFHFTAEGKYIKDTMAYETTELVNYLMSIVQYVDTAQAMKKTSAPSGFKDEVRDVLRTVPKDVLARMVQECKNIVFCVKQGEKNNTPVQTQFYRNEDGDKVTEYIPFKCQSRSIIVDGRNVKNLYFGIGAFLARYQNYQGEPLYNSTIWKMMYQNANGEIDNLMLYNNGYDVNGLGAWRASTEVTLASAIGWYYMDPSGMSEECNTLWKFLSSILGKSVKGPGEEQ